jgi:hypothetical protein
MPPIVEKISDRARTMIDAYLSLPIGAKPNCPYFNNRRRKIRGSLRVVKGKGTPAELAEECEIDAKLSRVKIAELSTDKLKEFLIANDLGIDCSGFAYHVLNSLSQEKNGKNIQNYIKTLRAGFVGALISRLRPAENIGVSTFAHEKNSSPIKITDAKPGDVIVFLGTGKDKTYNHILVVTGTSRLDSETRISYAHSYAWPSDGTTGHGVREGEILVHGDDLLGATWKEKGVTGDENFTYESAKNAKEVSVRRLKFNI